MKLILVRHGETESNIKNLSQGRFNSQLTDLGMNQARKVASRLKDYSFNVVFSSDLDRALNTAKEIVKFHDVDLIISKDLSEQAKGIFENVSRNDARYVEEKKIPFREWCPEGGESSKEVWTRVISFLDKLMKDYIDETVVLVSHGTPLNMILEYLAGNSFSNFTFTKLKNTSLCEINISNNEIDFKIMNCIKHLEEK